MQNYRFNLVFAVCFGAVVALLSWLSVSPDSPVELSSPDVKNALGFIHIIPFILATILSGNIHGGSETAYWVFVFAQWSIVGFLVALLFRGLRGHNDAANPQGGANGRQPLSSKTNSTSAAAGPGG